MIINIQNVLRTSQLSPEILANIARSSEFTAQHDIYYYRDCMKQDLLTAIVTCDKTVRGVCICKRSMIPDSCEIDSICIDADIQRKGLGKKLLAHSLRNMRSLHIRTAYLWVSDNNGAAMEFFTAFGFKPDGRRRNGEARLKIDIY